MKQSLKARLYLMKQFNDRYWFMNHFYYFSDQYTIETPIIEQVNELEYE